MKRAKRLFKLDRKGQSTIEFALAMIFLLGFTFLFTQMSMVFAFGNFVQYATFMSARAYLAAGPDEEDQLNRAQSTLIRLLKRSESQPGIDRWSILGEGEDGDEVIKGAAFGGMPGQFAYTDKSKSWLEGVRYSFRSRLLLLPLGSDASNSEVKLTSESWLTRERSFEDCFQSLESKLGVGEKVSIDNGC